MMLNREGLRLGNYRLTRVLGKGAFAEVYLGEHLYLKNYAAIKVLLTSLDEENEQLFLSEAQTLAQLVHPNIVRLRDFAIERSTPFLVMDYAAGGTLRQRHPKGSCLSLDLTVSYTKQVAAALQYAHNRGIIHRDVKPENILQGSESVMLSDFGISMHLPTADQSRSQSWAGTLPYIAPEQLQGEAVFASDQYSLAVIVYEWLCGVRPFEGSSTSLIYQHKHAPPPRLRDKDPSLPEAVETVVLKALSKNPKDRYASVLTFARALERASRESAGDLQSDTEQTYSPDTPSITRRVFLSHAPADDITRLKADLEMRDVAVVDGGAAVPPLGVDKAATGASDQQEEGKLRQAVRAAQIVLLIVSPQSRSSAAIKEQLRIANVYRRSVLCIWTAGDNSDELLPAGTETATLIDAREQQYGAALDEIVRLLERELHGAPRVESPPPADPTFEPRNPYKGLHAFTQSDRADFFGRESLVQEMLDSLRGVLVPTQPGTSGRRLLAVVGPSGSGKSSVVMAGLLPQLQDGALHTSETWLYLNPLVPGKQPLDALAHTLAFYFPNKDVQAIRETLGKKGGFGLHQLALDLAHTGTYVVLLIDQFEELFSADVSEQERQNFIDLLVTAATESRGPVLVLLTLRADLYDRPMAHPALGRLIQQNQCAVLPMDTEDLRSVIERPALQSDVRLVFDEDLVGDLLFDMHGQSGALPLLEFTLDQLFHHRRGNRLTRQAYEEIGGVRGALSRHAESTYDALPSDEHRRLARVVFMRLIQPGTTGQEAIRRRADLTEFSLENAEQTRKIREIIDTFVSARLLTINQVAGGTTLEVSHEALLREWQRLSDWIREASEDIHFQQELSNAAAEWERRGMPRDRLYRGSQLKESLTWLARNTASANETLFLRASNARHAQERFRLIMVVLVLFILLIPAALLTEQQFAPPTVTSLADSGPGSLRQVIESAQPGSTITFASNLKGKISLTSSLNITKDLTIRGPGAQQLSIGGNRTTGYLIGILPKGNATFADLSFSVSGSAPGSLISNQGKLALERCSINGNTNTGLSISTTANSNEKVGEGAAISSSGGTLIISDSIISHNAVDSSTSFGGAISGLGSTISITNSQITDNTVKASGQFAQGGAIQSANGTLTITGSTISGNKVIGGKKLITGGGISSINSTTTLTSSHITNNTLSTDQQGEGGGIYVFGGSLTINSSSITGNTLTANPAYGGGIASFNSAANGNVVTSKVTMTNTTVSNNTTKGGQQLGSGGGIFAEGSLTITGSTITNNAVTSAYNGNAAATGGGISALGTLSLTGTTVAGNTANASNSNAKGGGIFVTEPSTSSQNLTLINSTISNNTVSGSQGGIGGGIDARGTFGTIDFSTIYGNVASSQGGGVNLEVARSGNTYIIMKNSLVASNSAGTGPDIAGKLTTEGYNLIQRFSGTNFNDPVSKHGLDRSGSQFPDLGIDPQLRSNGGPTPTHALLANSPALKQIPVSACDVLTDQRGVRRPQQGSCDIGAYEAEH